MILMLLQKHVTNFSAADEGQQTLTKHISEFHNNTYITRPLLPSIYFDPPTSHEIYIIKATLKTKNRLGR